MDSAVDAAVTGLPRLRAGNHLDPSSGACFMEYASLLAGERWSDHPRCTHPALALLARTVNDALPDELRQRLVPAVPSVIGVAGRSAAVTPALVLLCAGRAEAAGRPGRSWRRCRRAARRRLAAAAAPGPAGVWCRLTDAAYRAGPGGRAIGRAVDTLAREPDAGGLDRLLVDAIAVAARCLARAEPGPAAADAADAADAAAAGTLPR